MFAIGGKCLVERDVSRVVSFVVPTCAPWLLELSRQGHLRNARQLLFLRESLVLPDVVDALHQIGARVRVVHRGGSLRGELFNLAVFLIALREIDRDCRFLGALAERLLIEVRLTEYSVSVVVQGFHFAGDRACSTRTLNVIYVACGRV